MNKCHHRSHDRCAEANNQDPEPKTPEDSFDRGAGNLGRVRVQTLNSRVARVISIRTESVDFGVSSTHEDLGDGYAHEQYQNTEKYEAMAPFIIFHDVAGYGCQRHGSKTNSHGGYPYGDTSLPDKPFAYGRSAHNDPDSC